MREFQALCCYISSMLTCRRQSSACQDSSVNLFISPTPLSSLPVLTASPPFLFNLISNSLLLSLYHLHHLSFSLPCLFPCTPSHPIFSSRCPKHTLEADCVLFRGLPNCQEGRGDLWQSCCQAQREECGKTENFQKSRLKKGTLNLLPKLEQQ